MKTYAISKLADFEVDQGRSGYLKCLTPIWIYELYYYNFCWKATVGPVEYDCLSKVIVAGATLEEAVAGCVNHWNTNLSACLTAIPETAPDLEKLAEQISNYKLSDSKTLSIGLTDDPFGPGVIISNPAYRPPIEIEVPKITTEIQL